MLALLRSRHRFPLLLPGRFSTPLLPSKFPPLPPHYVGDIGVMVKDTKGAHGNKWSERGRKMRTTNKSEVGKTDSRILWKIGVCGVFRAASIAPNVLQDFNAVMLSVKSVSQTTNSRTAITDGVKAEGPSNQIARRDNQSILNGWNADSCGTCVRDKPSPTTAATVWPRAVLGSADSAVSGENESSHANILGNNSGSQHCVRFGNTTSLSGTGLELPRRAEAIGGPDLH
jgi:hypothetical protein